MKLWAIIVTYHTSANQLKQLVQQLVKAGIKRKQIFIKDNTKKNIGYAAAVNLGLRAGIKNKFEYFLVLNPDIHLNKFLTTDIEQGFARFNIFGGVFKQGKKTYYQGLIDPVYLSGGLSTVRKKEQYYPADFVSGSLMFVDLKIIKTIGYLNKQYFMYYEDVDYCYRAQKNGLKVGINSRIRYTHFESLKNSLDKERYLKKNHRLFLDKYGAWWQKIAYRYKQWQNRDDRQKIPD